MSEGVDLGFVGDVMLGRNVDRRARVRDPKAVWGDVLERLTGLDGFFINLECCLSTRGDPWPGRPFHFRADPEWAVPALKAAGVDWCALANNHIRDYGDTALRDTLDALDRAEIAHAGAGRTEREALEPSLVTVDGLDVAVVSLTDNTPEYAATADAPGTARVEFDLERSESRQAVTDAIGRARGVDPTLIVASLHWGPNMKESPSEEFERFARWLIDRGVDVVHGHSAHVFQGIETYRDRPILYDTGDFLDDYRVDPDLRNDRSFLFVIRITDGTPTALRLHPVEIADCQVRNADDATAEWCRRTIRERSDRFDTSFKRVGDGLLVRLDD